MDELKTLLERFRALGGIADNIVLRDGEFGRGVFPEDAKLPVRISVPDSLLVPAEWVVLDSLGSIRLSDDAKWSAEAKLFYEDLQREFSWGAGTMEAIRQQQEQLIALPESVKATLMKFGMDPFSFEKPTMKWCLEKFKAARRFSRSGKYVMAPVLDMVNHSSQARSWDVEPLGISGVYSGEVLVNYSTSLDPFSMYDVYGFSAQSESANSVLLSLGHPQFGKMNIGRIFAEKTAMSGAWAPKVRRMSKCIDFSYLPLVNTTHPHFPREFFCQTMLVAGMDSRRAEDLFNSLLAANRKAFKQLQQSLDGVGGETAEGLRLMAQHQLDLLET